MATPRSSTQPRRPHIVKRLRVFCRIALRNFHRLYAAALIVLIGTLTYMAVHYLVTSLAIPKGPPPQIAALPARLSPEILQTDFAAWQALSATEHTRSPLAHYHRLDSWIEPDRFNDCTRSGCHAALPHSRRKEVRAFLNMHATSIHCGVCHIKNDERPLPTAWYDLKSGKISSTPAVLDIYDQLTSIPRRDRLLHATQTEQKAFVESLHRAANEVQDQRDLERLAEHFAAVRPSSAGYERLVSEASAILPSHFRGEYGSKIALRAPGNKNELLFGHPDTENAVQAWLSRSAGLSEEDKNRLLAAVHPLKREKALHCTDCHITQNSMIDFEKLGYPPVRRQALFGAIVFRMIEHISTGQAMHLPDMSPSGPATTSQPVSR